MNATNGARTSAPRLRDLGAERRPVTAVGEVIRVGEVGELPYASPEEAPPRRVPVVLVTVGAVILVVLVAALAFVLAA